MTRKSTNIFDFYSKYKLKKDFTGKMLRNER